MIEVRNLSFSYPHTKHLVLKNVSFRIKKGSYVAVLGHNGSGKSTLSKLFLNTYSPTSGSILIDGTPQENRSLIKHKIGVVFQNPDNQFIGCTVEDDIAFGLENRMVDPREIKKIVYKISKKVNMERFLEWEPQNLSGGQKQRVAIASVLALDPEIILFDEVTSMLDPLGKQEVLKIIEELKNSKNKTLISITHDMNEAILADWVLVFANGELIAQGPPQEILNKIEIIKKAKIDKPFIYKISELISGMTPSYELQDILKHIKKHRKKDEVTG